MSYPNIDNENFQKLIAKKFKQYKITKNPSFRELCFPKEYQLQKANFTGSFGTSGIDKAAGSGMLSIPNLNILETSNAHRDKYKFL
jgi:hypothetical protein